MKQKISKRAIFKISLVISGVICLAGALFIGVLSNYFNVINQSINTTYAQATWATLVLDGTDSRGVCTYLGDSTGMTGGVCNINTTTTITDQTVIVTNGATLIGNNNLTIEFTTYNPQDLSWDPLNGDSNPQNTGLVLVGAPPAAITPLPVSVSGVIVEGSGYMYHGVVMEGNGTTLSGCTVSDSVQSDILVARNASNFDLQSNTTSVSPIGVEVMHYTSTGTIDDHTASSHTNFGIEIFGSTSVDVTNSNLTGNNVGLYIHDAEWLQVYGQLESSNGTYNNTYGYVDGNVITGNTVYDISVDTADANAWDAAQSTSAINAYQTLNDPGGTFPIASPAYADVFLTIDGTDSRGDCVDTPPSGLGGSFSSGTCTVSSQVILENQTVVVTDGATLNANDNVMISFTASHPNDPSWSPGDPLSKLQTAGLILVGAPPAAITPLPVSADGVIVYGNHYMNHGVIMEGNGTTLSNSEAHDASDSDIVAARNASNFSITSNTTSGGKVGVQVSHYASDGTIDSHYASSQDEYGIEIYGSDNVEVINSTIINNGIAGLYIHDGVWSAIYGILAGADATITNTDGFVDNNTLTGNGIYDIAVDVTDASPWTAAQSTVAENTYNTLIEINGTFPEAPPNAGDPPAGIGSGFPVSDTFDLTVEVNGYQAITNDCTNAMDLTPSTPLSAQDGARFGSASCGIEVLHNDPTSNFQIVVNKSQDASLSDGTNTFADIILGAAACSGIDTTGNTEVEEYGYRLDNVSLVSGVTVQDDPECGIVAYNQNFLATNQFFFDIEYSPADTIVESTGLSPAPTCLSGECTFDLTVGANVDWDTYSNSGTPVTYSQFSTSGNYTIDITTVVLP